MNGMADYSDEMHAPWQVDDDTAEALLASRGVTDDLAPLARILEAYRAAGQEPVAPRGELAVLMATGAFVSAAGRHRPAVTRINGHGPRTAALPRWRRTRTAVLGVLSTVAAKVAGLGMAAKATAGVAIATASVATVGFTGTLPEPVQDRFDDVVGVVTGNERDEPAGEQRDENAEFGERVSDDAKDGGVDGGEISEEAKQQGDLRRPTDPGRPDGAGKPDGSGKPNEPGKPGKPDELPTPGDPPAGGPGDNPGQAPDDAPAPPDAPPRP